jgi:hypothetical protein
MNKDLSLSNCWRTLLFNRRLNGTVLGNGVIEIEIRGSHTGNEP